MSYDELSKQERSSSTSSLDRSSARLAQKPGPTSTAEIRSSIVVQLRCTQCSFSYITATAATAAISKQFSKYFNSNPTCSRITFTAEAYPSTLQQRRGRPTFSKRWVLAQANPSTQKACGPQRRTEVSHTTWTKKRCAGCVTKSTTLDLGRWTRGGQ